MGLHYIASGFVSSANRDWFYLKPPTSGIAIVKRVIMCAITKPDDAFPRLFKWGRRTVDHSNGLVAGRPVGGHNGVATCLAYTPITQNGSVLPETGAAIFSFDVPFLTFHPNYVLLATDTLGFAVIDDKTTYDPAISRTISVLWEERF